jgi:hypothetical protein
LTKSGTEKLKSAAKVVGSKKRGGVGLKKQDMDVKISLGQIGPVRDGEKRAATFKSKTD